MKIYAIKTTQSKGGLTVPNMIAKIEFVDLGYDRVRVGIIYYANEAAMDNNLEQLTQPSVYICSGQDFINYFDDTILSIENKNCFTQAVDWLLNRVLPEGSYDRDFASAESNSTALIK